jgi:IS5 family transposase
MIRSPSERERGTMQCRTVPSETFTVYAQVYASVNNSQLLNDGVRVLSRYLAKCRDSTGVKFRFKDHRKAARSLAARIFYAKGADKAALYGELLPLTKRTVQQVVRATARVRNELGAGVELPMWLDQIEHYRELTERVIRQTERRVIGQETVPTAEKIVSLFEPHTDIIVKGGRDIQYGHKINLATDERGMITSLVIEEGNPSDADRFLPIIESHQALYGCYPETAVADGGYASKDNVTTGRGLGLKRVVFHKTRGITPRAMGIQQRTLKKWRSFRAGIEGNISELKRAFGAARALWKGHDGFHADVWAAVISYNLTHRARLLSG